MPAGRLTCDSTLVRNGAVFMPAQPTAASNLRPRVSNDPSQEPDDPSDLDDKVVAAAAETDWLTAARAGDRAAFAKVVNAYWERLFRWLFHMTRDRHRAEDLTQETFLKALAALDSFRPGTNFRAWLFRIGHNNFVNLKRSERRTTRPLPEETAAVDDGGPGRGIAEREVLAVVAAAIADLPADFRAALLLRAEEGLSFKEIAVVLSTTEETARWRVFKARQKLVRTLPPELLPPSSDQ